MCVGLNVIYNVVVLVIVSECTGIEILNWMTVKRMSRQIVNDHSTSKVLGYSDQTINKTSFDLCM